MSIRTIARNLGVSPSAVSLALRGSVKISENTKRKIVEEADRIGYRPDGSVRQLMTQVRYASDRSGKACIGVFSFYQDKEPWKENRHFAAIYESMKKRAGSLGYRLEPIDLIESGMTAKRYVSILDARGIKGLLCFGSPDFKQKIPTELDHFAMVGLGLSVETPMHRVTSHFYNDLLNTLNRLYELGYRRPGLLLGTHEENRSQFAYPAAYYGWCKQRLGNRDFIPVLRMEKTKGRELIDWYEEAQPDVIVMVHLYHEVETLYQTLLDHNIRVPQDVGVAAVTQLLDHTPISGKVQNQALIGAWAVEMLESRMAYQDFGIPKHPRIEMVESTWHEGRTLKNH